jgi:hypothetical protein
VDEAGNADGNTVVQNTTLTDVTAPTFTGLQSIISYTASGATLTWNAASDTLTSTPSMTYLVFSGASSAEVSTNLGYASPPASGYVTTSAGATSYVVNNMAPFSTKYFAVRACDNAASPLNFDSNTVILPIDLAPPTFGGITLLDPNG